ncbi:MAG: LysR family transcriptional regulator [Rhizobiaceae bacterium]
MGVKDSPLPVPESEHSELNFDWNDVQFFVLVAQCGSLRSASQKANRSVNSLRRRLELLEHKMNRRLLVRDATGTYLTEHGQRLLAVGNGMYEASLDVADEFARAEQEQSHSVSIDVDDGLTSYWLMPRAPRFVESDSYLQLDFRSPLRSRVSAGSQCDLTICTNVPSRRNLMVTRLGYLHVQPFASRSFVKRHGEPEDPAALDTLPLVERSPRESEHVGWAELVSKRLERNISVLANSGCSQFAAVCNGAGVGLLPTYLASADDRLVPLLEGMRQRRDIYLTYRRDVAEHRRVRLVIDWLKGIFNTRQALWFSEHYVSPTKTSNDQTPTE